MYSLEYRTYVLCELDDSIRVLVSENIYLDNFFIIVLQILAKILHSVWRPFWMPSWI